MMMREIDREIEKAGKDPDILAVLLFETAASAG